MDVDPADDTPLPSSPFSALLFALLFPPDDDEFMVEEATNLITATTRRNNNNIAEIAMQCAEIAQRESLGLFL